METETDSLISFSSTIDFTSATEATPASNKSCPVTQSRYDLYISLLSHGAVFIIGVIGNSLVIFVITRYTKMKTVTNLYILNLSIADLVFLMGMPLIMTTMSVNRWVFGFEVCKIFYILTCINMFTSSMTLMLMAGDRFLAVCFPIRSMRYRTPMYALLVIGFTWALSLCISMPIILHAKTVKRGGCTIDFPSYNNISGSTIYIAYTSVLGFLSPVLVILVLYTLLVVRLRASGVAVKQAHKRRPHRKVTKLVTLVITVFIFCSLPYWAFQVYIVSSSRPCMSYGLVIAYKVFSLLHYSNSMVNPLLYAFTNQNFRESFISAFKCAADPILLGGRATDCKTGELQSEGATTEFPKTKSTNSKTEYGFTKLTTVSSDKLQSNGETESPDSTMKDKCVETAEISHE